MTFINKGASRLGIALRWNHVSDTPLYLLAGNDWRPVPEVSLWGGLGISGQLSPLSSDPLACQTGSDNTLVLRKDVIANTAISQSQSHGALKSKSWEENASWDTPLPAALFRHAPTHRRHGGVKYLLLGPSGCRARTYTKKVERFACWEEVDYDTTSGSSVVHPCISQLRHLHELAFVCCAILRSIDAALLHFLLPS